MLFLPPCSKEGKGRDSEHHPPRPHLRPGRRFFPTAGREVESSARIKPPKARMPEKHPQEQPLPHRLIFRLQNLSPPPENIKKVNVRIYSAEHLQLTKKHYFCAPEK